VSTPLFVELLSADASRCGFSVSGGREDIVRKSGFFVFVLVAALLFVTGSSWAAVSSSPGDQFREPLADAAKAAGVAINTDSVVTASGERYTVAATTIQGFEQVGASALPDGVDTGFIYLDAPGSGIPAGFYTLRTTAPAESVRVGEFGAKTELVGADGRVVTTLPARVEASSTEVPNPLPFARTTVDIRTDHQPQGIIIIDIIYRCPNGMVIHIRIIIW
jgi:hypothetical protein